jgi:SAM-dependent methyltransferase
MDAQKSIPPDQPSGFWDTWNREWRFREDHDAFMQRQRDAAISVVGQRGQRDLRILDVGCGTGWLGNSLVPFGRVWGIDLSPSAIAEGTQRHPAMSLICGEFMDTDLPGPFDLVLSADALPFMPDHEAFFQRLTSLVKPGGMVLLMTPNPVIWRRRSKLRRLPSCVPNADPVTWPSSARIQGLLKPAFIIEQVSGFDPGGDRGLLWWVENRYVRGGMGLLFGSARWRSLLERVGLGRELIIAARRKS